MAIDACVSPNDDDQSQHPQKIPGILQRDVDGVELGATGGWVGAEVIGGDEVDDEVIDVVEVGSSQHPQKSPGVLQCDEVEVVIGFVDVTEAVGVG